MTKPNRCVIENVAIPLDLSDKFIPPDLKKAVEYYPNFIRISGLSWPIRAYFLRLLKEIDETRPGGYDGQVAGSRFIEYYGLSTVEKWFKELDR